MESLVNRLADRFERREQQEVARIQQVLDLVTTASCQTAALHPDALGHPRQQARFLCGLTSPALTRSRLSSHRLFGALAEHRFADVLAWCSPAS